MSWHNPPDDLPVCTELGRPGVHSAVSGCASHMGSSRSGVSRDPSNVFTGDSNENSRNNNFMEKVDDIFIS